MSIARRLAKLEASAPPPPVPPRPLTMEEREARVAAILARLPEDPAEWVARAEAGEDRFVQLLAILDRAARRQSGEVGDGA